METQPASVCSGPEKAGGAERCHLVGNRHAEVIEVFAEAGADRGLGIERVSHAETRRDIPLCPCCTWVCRRSPFPPGRS